MLNLFGIVHGIADEGSTKDICHRCLDFSIITNKRKGEMNIVFTNLTRKKRMKISTDPYLCRQVSCKLTHIKDSSQTFC